MKLLLVAVALTGCTNADVTKLTRERDQATKDVYALGAQVKSLENERDDLKAKLDQCWAEVKRREPAWAE